MDPVPAQMRSVKFMRPDPEPCAVESARPAAELAIDSREGLGAGEARWLQWRHIDLSHGVLRLDVNKTGVPRVWALSDGVKRALAAMYEEQGPDARVFPSVELELGPLRPLDECLPEVVERVGAPRVFQTPSTPSPSAGEMLNDSVVVRETGVEPARLAALEPKSSASANSATRALGGARLRTTGCTTARE
jgi:hypothetical protein